MSPIGEQALRRAWLPEYFILVNLPGKRDIRKKPSFIIARENMGHLGLIKRRNVWLPTWRGWVLVFLVVAAALMTGMYRIHAFLAVNQPVGSDVMVVEGWLPDFALKKAVQIFKSQNYHLMVVTGGPLEAGSVLIDYKNYAQLAATILEHMGLEKSLMVVIPAPDVTKDRTYASAVALKNWLTASQLSLKTINLVSLGAHARRSRRLFAQALGPGVTVGIMALEDPRYDHRRWWKSSLGVRMTLGEIIAYGYARFFFKP
jgi:hypothetical protein